MLKADIRISGDQDLPVLSAGRPVLSAGREIRKLGYQGLKVFPDSLIPRYPNPDTLIS